MVFLNQEKQFSRLFFQGILTISIVFVVIFLGMKNTKAQVLSQDDFQLNLAPTQNDDITVSFNDPGAMSGNVVYQWTRDPEGAAEKLILMNVPFNAGTTQYDYSGFAHHSVASSGIVAAKLGDGLNGDAWFGDMPEFNNLEQVSVSIWVNYTGTTLGWIAGEDQVFALRVNPLNNSLMFHTGENWDGSVLESQTHLTTGNWYHVVATYNGAVKRFYINGIADSNVQNTFGNIGSNTLNFTVGVKNCGVGCSEEIFAGTLDELQIYGTAITEGQVEILYNNQLNQIKGATAIAEDMHESEDSWFAQVYEFDPLGSAPAQPIDLGSATVGVNTTNWAWNDNIGWIAHDSTIAKSRIPFGVTIESDGNISGYGWSENIGWIDYDPLNQSCPSCSYPITPYHSAQWDENTEQVSGWAYIPSIAAAGQNGWLLLRGDCYPSCGGFGVTINKEPNGWLGTSWHDQNRLTGNWSGYAWNEVIGWVQYNYAPFGNSLTVFEKPTLKDYIKMSAVPYDDDNIMTVFTEPSVWDSSLVYQWIKDPEGTSQPYLFLNLPFNSGSTQYDLSGNNNNASVFNQASYFSNGVVGGGIRVDSLPTQGRLSVSNPVGFNGMNEITISAWVNPDQVANDHCVVCKEGVFQLAISQGRIKFVRGTSPMYSPAESSVPVGTWSHIVATYDGINKKIYMNGSQVINTPDSGDLGTSLYNVIIGARNLNPVDYTDFYSGLIDEVQIYSHGLSADQVEVLYQDGLAGRAGPTVIDDGEHSINQAWLLRVFEIDNSGRLFTPGVDIASVIVGRNTERTAEVEGYGYLAHNSVDINSSTPFAVNILESGNISGYGYNGNLGLIDYDPLNQSCPLCSYPGSPSNSAFWHLESAEVDGWAYVKSLDDNGLDPWISMGSESAESCLGCSGCDQTTVDLLNSLNVVIPENDCGSLQVVSRSSQGGADWEKLCLDTSSHPEILAYRIRWFSGYYSEWYTKGLDDINWKNSGYCPPVPGSYNNRVWSYFQDHYHQILQCNGCNPTYYDTLGVTINYNGNWNGNAYNPEIGLIQYHHVADNTYTHFWPFPPNTPVLVEPVDLADTYDLFGSSALRPVMRWSSYSAVDGSSQKAYQIQIDDDPLFGSPEVNDTLVADSNQYAVGLGELAYKQVYYWRVRVQNAGNDEWSQWGTSGVSNESNSFRTPLHAPPDCVMSMFPSIPPVGTPTFFKDKTLTYESTPVLWLWNFGDGNTSSEQNPEHTYDKEAQVSISLQVRDSDGYECSTTQDLRTLLQLPEIKRVIPR